MALRDDPKSANEVGLQDIRHRIHDQLKLLIVGQESVIDELLITLFAGGHCLLEGPGGLAKTSMVRALADTLDLSFKRIQFTADLWPPDILGNRILQENRVTGVREYEFHRGPIFANIVLADEINRGVPKVQSALLQAMEERKLTLEGEDFHLDAPFHVLATQNPMEQEGTYALPEAQLDRFLMQILVKYPSSQDEIRMMQTATTRREVVISPVIHRLELIRAQGLVEQFPVPQQVYDYAARIVRATRVGEPEAVDFINEWLSFGAGPRASLGLISAAQARAVLNGQVTTTIDDVRAVIRPVLRHRLVTNFSAESEGVSSDMIITRLLERIG